MKFAHFSHVWCKTGMTPAQRYQQLWRELVLCDELGFDFGFSVEHHFRPDESWMSDPAMYAVAAGARTRRMRLGAMGHIVPLHHPVRLAEEIALADQMIDGRLEVGLVPGILTHYFTPFGVDYDTRREVTMEFVAFLRAAYTDAPAFDFDGRFHKATDVKLSINPAQRPHPPLWMETRDPKTLEFCAREGLNTGYFILFPRRDAAPRYRKFLADWQAAGWTHKPNIAYSTVVYVDETDEAAMRNGLAHAAQAYGSHFPRADTPAGQRAMMEERARQFEARGEPGAAEIMRHLTDADFLLENELILVGSPDTVATKLKAWAEEGVFNTFFGEFNFAELPEAHLMRSIRLFGTEVMPRLRDYEPF